MLLDDDTTRKKPVLEHGENHPIMLVFVILLFVMVVAGSIYWYNGCNFEEDIKAVQGDVIIEEYYVNRTIINTTYQELNFGYITYYNVEQEEVKLKGFLSTVLSVDEEGGEYEYSIVDDERNKLIIKNVIPEMRKYFPARSVTKEIYEVGGKTFMDYNGLRLDLQYVKLSERTFNQSEAVITEKHTREINVEDQTTTQKLKRNFNLAGIFNRIVAKTTTSCDQILVGLIVTFVVFIALLIAYLIMMRTPY